MDPPAVRLGDFFLRYIAISWKLCCSFVVKCDILIVELWKGVVLVGYLFALLAVAAGVTKGYCGKRTSGSVATFGEAMVANSVRMSLCVVIGFLILAVRGDLGLLRLDGMALLITVGSGIFSAAFVVTWLIAVKRSAYMMLDVFLLLGSLIPMLLCQWLFGERITLPQWAGLIVLLAAVFIMCSYSAGLKGKLSLSGLGLLLLCALSCGLADFCQKAYTQLYPGADAAVFNFYTYLAAGVLLIICRLLTPMIEESKSRSVRATVIPIFGYVAIMAFCLFANSFFKVQAAGFLTASQLFPFTQGVGIAVSTIMAAIFFREKITPRCVVGLVLAFAGLIIMNML